MLMNTGTDNNAKRFSEDEVLAALMGEIVIAVGEKMTYRLTYDGAKARNQFKVTVMQRDGEGILRTFAVVDGNEENIFLLRLV
jgi:hypothetical protein